MVAESPARRSGSALENHPMIIPDVKAKAAFTPEHYHAVPLARSNVSVTMLVCLKAGQYIPVHAPGVDLCLLILEGRGRWCDGRGEASAGPGDLLLAAIGEMRGVLAQTDMVALATVTPPPGPTDHDTVQRLLKKGRWRDVDTSPVSGCT